MEEERERERERERENRRVTRRRNERRFLIPATLLTRIFSYRDSRFTQSKTVSQTARWILEGVVVERKPSPHSCGLLSLHLLHRPSFLRWLPDQKESISELQESEKVGPMQFEPLVTGLEQSHRFNIPSNLFLPTAASSSFRLLCPLPAFLLSLMILAKPGPLTSS